MSKYKLLVTSGCSFTAGYSTWPNPLSQKLNCHLKNYAIVSVGNGRISRSIIYGVNEALKEYHPDDILVGIIWSGSNRREFFQSDVDLENITTTGTANPHRFIDQADDNWVTLNHHWNDVYSKIFYKYFYDEVDSEIITLEHILRAQWFLEKKNVKYFMSCFAPAVLPHKENVNTKHLMDMVDWSKFLNVSSYMEWCLDSGVPINENDKGRPLTSMHPTPEHDIKFVNDVIIPFVNKL